MAAVPLSLGGLSGDSGDERALFLKVFSGEVLNAYERAIKISPLLTTRTITSGKSAQFPTTGVALARYFQPGESLFLDSSGDSHAMISTIAQSERVIHIDNLLTASCFIDQLDEAISHYDYRAAFANELGAALARHQDNYALHTIGASCVDTNDGDDGEQTPTAKNTIETCVSFYTDPAAAVQAIYNCSQKLDEKDVPREDRVVLMPPLAYYNLLKAGVLSIGMHATSDTRGLHADAGVRGEASGTMIAGMPVVVSNADGFASTDDAADAGFIADTKGGAAADTAGAEHDGMRNLGASGALGTALGGDGVAVDDPDDDLACIVFHKSVAGIVKLKDITMEQEYLIERQGTLMVAKMAQGMGALRNDAGVIIKTG
jgi:hypothetical protein